MTKTMAQVSNFAELQTAIKNQQKEIVIKNAISCYHSILLPDNTTLRGEEGKVAILLFNSGDGVGVTTGSTVKNLCIQTNPNNKAIYLDSSEGNLGKLTFENLTLTGQFSIVTRRGVMSADIHAKNIDVVSADARNNAEMPQGYGVNVIQGAFTIYHMNEDIKSQINVTAENISVGRKGAPVIGSGIFVGCQINTGGKLNLIKLQTGNVYSNGMIPFGVADMITAGVFTLYGVNGKSVINDGEVITYGVNDMVLDNWGFVESWVANKPITSYGPSGIGFVNFGTVKKFVANAPFTTYGLGARGYNQYDNTTEDITLHSITTYGDGSIGIQLGKPIGKLTVTGDITTYGSVGNSLVSGVNTQLLAMALSVKEGGAAKSIDIKGNLITNGDNVVTLQVNGGKVDEIKVGGQIITNGKNSTPIIVENNGKCDVSQLKVKK